MPAEHEHDPSRAEPLQVTVIRDVEDLPTTQQRLHDLSDPGRGTLVIRPVPHSVSSGDFTLCVLNALGKTLPATLTGTPRPWDQAVSWVTGYRLRHLVVDRAHTLPPQFVHQVLDLLGPPRPHRTRLWLIDASHTNAAPITAALTDQRPDAHVTVTGPGGLDQLPAPPMPAEPPSTASVPIPDDLPDDSFMTFRAACARQLDRHTAARADAVWVRVFDDARAWVTAHRKLDAIHRSPIDLALPLSLKLAAGIYRSATAGEALVRLRATQAGLLREGLLLHHQAWPGDPGLGHRLTLAAVSAINQTLTTQEAAAATLYLLFPYGQRATERFWHPDELTLGDVSPAAGTITIRGVHLPVPEHARPALLAHRTFRCLHGAPAPSDEFFHTRRPRPDPRRLADKALAATTARGDLTKGHPTIPGENGTLWMRQRRLALRNLVGNPHHLDLSAPTWT